MADEAIGDAYEAFDEFRDKLVEIGLSEAQTQVFIGQGITDPSLLALLTDEDLVDLFNIQGLRTVNRIVRIRIRAFKSWIRSNGDAEVQMNECNEETLNAEMDKIARGRDGENKHTQKEATPSSPEKFDGRLSHWTTFRLSVESYFARLKNAQGRAIHYVIKTPDGAARVGGSVGRDIGDDITVQSDISIRVGPQYDDDNRRVFQELKALTAGGSGWTHIRTYDATENGRGAWMNLRRIYEGDAMIGAIRSEARKKIANSFYNGETRKMTLERFIDVHKSAHMDLADHGSAMPEDQRVEELVQHIQDSKLQTVCDSITTNFAQDFDGAVAFLQQRARQLDVIRPYTNENRKIGSLKSGKSDRGGRGRGGSGRGRGRGDGRGGRGPRVPASVWNQLDSSAKKAILDARKRKVSQDDSRVVKKVTITELDNNDEDKDGNDKDSKPSAGERFGRNSNRTLGAIHSSNRRISPLETRVIQAQKHRSGTKLHGRFGCDSHADTTCLGASWVVLEYTEQVCNVHPYSEKLPPLENIPIVTGATAYDHPDTGDTYILVVPQALWLGADHNESLICPNQIRSFGHEVDDIPKQFSKGDSIHGIRIDGNLTLPFMMDGCISYLPTRKPTENELTSCERIILTSEMPWDPQSKQFSERETSLLLSESHVSATVSKNRTLQYDHKILQKRLGGISEQTVKDTILATTQLGTRDGILPLHKRYRTRQMHLRYRRFDATFYSDTMKAAIKSSSGNVYSQIFVNNTNFVFHYPMKLKSQASEALQTFIHTIGIPNHLHTDNAFEETRGAWQRECREYCIKQTTTEPHSPWQNRAEREIQESKKTHRRLMDTYRVPPELWDYSIRFAGELRTKIAHPHLGGRTAWEILTGDTPDISHLLHFDFYQPVLYLEPTVSFPESKEKLGRWLGPAHGIGQAMCYFVLKDNGQVIARSTVRSADLSDAGIQRRVAEFDKEISTVIGEHEFSTEAVVDQQDENQYFDYEENDHLLDGLIGAEVLLPHGDDNAIAQVIRRKRDSDGALVGKSHEDERLDTREYVIQFPDGVEETHVVNTLTQALYSRVEEDGNKYYVFEDLIGHKRGKGGRGKTKGWLLEVLWKDGTTTWETLSSMKESSMLDVAKYAINNGLEKEPAFAFWVPHAIQKQDRLIKTMQRRKMNNGYKYGIKVPRSVRQALDIDKEQGNMLWRDAIAKEMKNVQCAFEFLPEGSLPPPLCKKIPLRMIFDVKMDFTRKARLVAGGHVTDPPTTLTYSSVASRDSIRIAFLLAGINDLDILMADIGNAYLNAKTKEKVYAVAGPEFGDMEGRFVVIVRALYGLKSSGASWHSHLADTLRDVKFLPSKADPDVWLRPATKANGVKYYEYIVVYVDDMLILSHDPTSIIKELSTRYRLKDVGPPTRYLGATVGKHKVLGPQGSGERYYWSLSAEEYLKNAIRVVEMKYQISTKHASTPLEANFHPEIDASELLCDDEANYYQSLIGVLQWVVELGRIDICYHVSSMARFSCAPRVAHLRNVLRIFAYLKTHIRSKLVMDYERRGWENIDFPKHDWEDHYFGVKEPIPPNLPEPRGKPVQINFFCDAAHATDLATRRSVTGILIFCNGAPIKWYSKRQNTIETSSYGSEFVAMRIGVEMVEGMRYKLRMFGVPLDGPANGFCDNQSVVINSTIPSSTLKKKHNSVAYHKVRESIASGAIRLAKEPGSTNLADILTKALSAPRMKFLASRIMH